MYQTLEVETACTMSKTVKAGQHGRKGGKGIRLKARKQSVGATTALESWEA